MQRKPRLPDCRGPTVTGTLTTFNFHVLLSVCDLFSLPPPPPFYRHTWQLSALESSSPLVRPSTHCPVPPSPERSPPLSHWDSGKHAQGSRGHFKAVVLEHQHSLPGARLDPPQPLHISSALTQDPHHPQTPLPPTSLLDKCGFLL